MKPTKKNYKWTKKDYATALDCITYAAVFQLNGPTCLSRKATKLLEKVYGRGK